MLDDLLYPAFELIVILSDGLETCFLVDLQVSVQLEQPPDFFLLGGNQVVEILDLSIVIGPEVGLPLIAYLSLRVKLRFVVLGQLPHSLLIPVVILF